MGKPIIKLHRFKQDWNQTSGTVTVLDDDNDPVFASISLERGWRNNQVSVSCIPEGVYSVVLEYSNRFKKDLWEIKDVPGRSECKFHAANLWSQLNGCVALGTSPRDINNDGYLDPVRSRDTMKEFHRVLDGHTEALLIITTEPNVN
jgi:hypothetical protein